MGGYSQQCHLCGKWYTNFHALKDHYKDKHHVARSDVPYRSGSAPSFNQKETKNVLPT